MNNEIDFEVDERLQDIRLQYISICEIKDSVADNRREYREFASSLNINKESLFRCCDEFERSLLINCYTFIEQFFKSCVYFLLQKDLHENKYINRLINKKLPASKYSPNVKLEELEKQIEEFFEIEFKFILKPKLEALEKYKDLVNSRHIYAHKGLFNFNFENFEGAIQALEYIKYEIEILVSGEENRKNFQKIFLEFHNYTIFQGYMRALDNAKSEKEKEKKRREAKQKLVELKEKIIRLKEFINLEEEIELLKNCYIILRKIDTVNLEEIANQELYNLLKEYMEMLNILREIKQ